MNDLEHLQTIYPYDRETGVITIPILLENYSTFFMPLDPSPPSRRDLAVDLVEYLNQCSTEIPLRIPIALAIQILASEPDRQCENDCLASLRTYFNHKVFIERAEIRRSRIVAAKYLLISLLLLFLYLATERAGPTPMIANLLREAALIGGWVFTWEAVSINFIQMDQHHQAIKKYKRLIQAQMNFTHSEHNRLHPSNQGREVDRAGQSGRRDQILL